MPGLAQSIDSQFNNATRASSLYSISGSNGSISANEFWSKHRDDVSYNQLQKFWGDLSPQARQELLRIDKHTLFEQARKNMYCSRCNGLLLEGFLQIVMYGKSLQQEGTVDLPPCNRLRPSNNQPDGDSGITAVAQDDVQDPSVHPWGGLTTTRDATLTLLDCYLFSKSLMGLQNVFDSARARERERELLYPDACGGGGRGWISQGMVGYGRGHGTRETCALHTAKLSVDTLVDFWSALGDETRQSLLRMKEEDFIERLMYRFDSKRFCRDCRRNVIREFKELKELKRMRREPRCTSWFCVADTAFQYEVSHDTIQADWNQNFADSAGTYHHFEWAVGTGEGKSDILDFENVGTSGRVQVNGLDLGGLNACYITLRAWKMDGRCNEISVKAHALKGQQCVHCRLVVGDGLVTITRGESIRRFFEHAEEAEEEEDEESMDKDGNELDGECSRPQKHAKNPELAREFLLDAATVIFKEQVEKAFREGTARQNAHSIFVCLALKLLERRVHVACKEIITLEKQTKLLEEEEKEKRDEEERKERRRTKEREKKLRRKERLRGKDKDRDKKSSSDSYQDPVVSDLLNEENSIDEDHNVISNRDSVSETGDTSPSRPLSPDLQEKHFPNRSIISNVTNLFDNGTNVEFAACGKEGNVSFTVDNSRVSRWKMKLRKDFTVVDSSLKWPDRRRFAVVSESGGVVSKPEPSRCNGDNFEFSSRGINGLNKQQQRSGSGVAKTNIRNVGGLKFSDKFYCSNCSRMSDRYEYHSCSCNQQQNDYRAIRVSRDEKCENKSVGSSEISKPYYRGSKYNQVEYATRESCGRPRSSKNITGSTTATRDSIHHPKQVWEPMESQKKYPRSSSASDLTLRPPSTFRIPSVESNNHTKACDEEVITEDLHDKFDDDDDDDDDDDNSSLKDSKSRSSSGGIDRNCRQNEFQAAESEEAAADHEGVEPFPIITSSSSLNGTMDSSSNSDNCSSCISEGDSSNTSSSSSSNSSPTLESLSTSDSEDAGQQHSEGRGKSTRTLPNGFHKCHEVAAMEENKQESSDGFPPPDNNSGGKISPANETASHNAADNGGATAAATVSMGGSQHHQGMLPPPMHHNNQSVHFPVFQTHHPLTMGGYYQSSPVSWSAAPAPAPAPAANGGGGAGFIPFPHPNHHYVFASPYGYGLNGNSRYTQYGSIQHPTPPPPTQVNHHHPVQVPVYHHQSSMARGGANGGMMISSKEQIKYSMPSGGTMQKAAFNEGGNKEEGVGVFQRTPQEEHHHPSGGGDGDVRSPPKEKSDKSSLAAAAAAAAGNSGFSLFHFGGPQPPSAAAAAAAAAVAGCKSNYLHSKEGSLDDLSSSLSDNTTTDGGAGNKEEDNVKEYNLFAAASNGIRFSFF